MKNFLRITGLTGFSLALSFSGEAVRATNLGIDPMFQDRFRITEFATGLDFPNGILQLGDGSMLIGTTNGNGFFDANAKSQLVRLQDTNGDGIADNKTVLYDGLSGGVTAIRAVDNYLFVTSIGGNSISVFQQGADLSANSLTLKGALNFSFPSGTVHSTGALAVRKTEPQKFELFFNLGAYGNNQATTPGSISLNGAAFNLSAPNLDGDSIYKIPVTVGSNLTLDAPVLVATGLRNAAALEFDKATGDLYIGENGIDGLPVSQGGTGSNEPLTADELNRLTPSQLESAAVENFGFPNYGEKYRSPGVFINGLGQTVNSSDPSLISSIANFQPVPNPTTGAESEGAASIAFAPADFPTELNNGVFVGFFGRFGYGTNDDRENALVYYNLANNTYSHFLSTNRGGDFGHFTSLLSTQNSLFAVDIGTGSGGLFSSAGLGRGTVYQIQATQTAQAVPEPFTIVGTLIGGTAALRMRKKLKDGNKA